MIAIIDYDAGNQTSVANALNHLGYSCELVNDPKNLENKSMIVLPGVGSAQATKRSLMQLGIWDALDDLVLHRKIPFLGICVGLQVLFEHSEEDGVDCLGWIPGRVKKYDSSRVRVPQMGWNSVDYQSGHPLYSLVKGESLPYFYFVNSFYALPDDREVVLGSTQYDVSFCSLLNRDNIFATQFHIEKSGHDGLLLLRKIVNHVVTTSN